MAESTIYTVSYLLRDADHLFSGGGSEVDPFSDERLLEEFRKHSDPEMGQDPALVDVSRQIIDTLQLAFRKYRLREQPDAIWIAFIEVPAGDNTRGHPMRVHAAEELAIRTGHATPELYRDDALVERAIPREYVVHRVSLQTLLDRGLLGESMLPQPEPRFLARAIEDLWDFVQDMLYASRGEPWGAGVFLARFASTFGARAPLLWIVDQVLDDCEVLRRGDGGTEADGGVEAGSVGWTGADIDDMYEGVQTALFDRWLDGPEFVRAYTHLQEQEAVEQGIMFNRQVQFLEDWHADFETRFSTLSDEAGRAFDEAYTRLVDAERQMLELFEREAVRIGL